jgi:hypothetical protein
LKPLQFGRGIINALRFNFRVESKNPGLARRGFTPNSARTARLASRASRAQ